MTHKKNNKGFSLVELIVVITIMGLAVTLAGGSMSLVYSARSKRAAETLDAVIAQSKIDAMSGLDCVLAVRLNDGDYYAELYRTDEDSDDDDYDLEDMVLYKSEKLASDRLTITVGNGGDTIEDDEALIIKFNRSTGSIDFAEYDDNDIFTSSAKSVITLSSIGTHTVTLYKSSGEHVLDA